MLVREMPFFAGDVEVVEHKGLGHPDTLCDGAAEAASRALCRAYLDEHGALLHHNVDKALLVGGRANVRFGGGEVVSPMVLYLAGRAADPGGQRGRARAIAVAAAREWLASALHGIDVDRDVTIDAFFEPGSADLVELFARGRAANDSSIGVGHAPLSPTERAVLAVSRRLREMAHGPARTAGVGEDVKVMAVRRGAKVALTVACATIARHVPDLAAYVALRSTLASAARAAALEVVDGALDVDVVVNAADDVERGRVYLTVTGTSAEAGDDGQVGRGNRVNGLITPYRPMTLEAAAGKNPATHAGKLYAVAADAIARDVARAVAAVTHVECVLVSRIGAPIDEPVLADVRVALDPGEDLAHHRGAVEDVVRAGIAAVPSMWKAFVRGEIALY